MFKESYIIAHRGMHDNKSIYENTKESFITYINGVLDNRKSEMQSLITTIKNKG